jgi:hypothetical protein
MWVAIIAAMQREGTPYHERFPEGSEVRISDRTKLEDFRRAWKFHHPISAEQIAYAGTRDLVVGVAFYHGGDALYQLKNAPGKWHEVLLESV